MNRQKTKSPSWARYITNFFLITTVLFCLFIFLVWFGFFGHVPGNQELRDIRHQEASQVLSADGELMGTYFFQNRTHVPLEEVNTRFTDALLAVEDIRFYEHNGVDYRALARVLLKSVFLGQDAGGGSTLSQQLAKNLYPRQNNSRLYLAADKLREMIIARRLENLYSKDEILELYINSVSFGEETYGIEMASLRFFNKAPADLLLHEAAVLAGLLKATSWYNPYRNPERSEQRRNLVLRQMVKYGMISAEEAGEAIERPLETDYNRISSSSGLAPYFREHLRMELQQILKNQPARDGNSYNLYTDGLMIETTLDSRVQRSAEQAIQTQIKHLQDLLDKETAESPFFGEDDPDIIRDWQRSDHYKQLLAEGYSDEEIEEVLHTPVQTTLFTWDEEPETKHISPYDSLRYYHSLLNAGFLAVHPNSGDVLAWVGGIDHHYFKYDHVKTRRQSGSAFKPVLYSAAFETGRKPCDYQRNILSSYAAYEDWTPKNSREEYGGRYSLQAALARSVNTVAVDVLMETGIRNVQSTARQMGITSFIPPEPSIALGTAGVTLLELTTAYTTFLNGGNPVSPKFIKQIYNNRGELIYDFEDELENSENYPFPYRVEFANSVENHPEQTNAISPETAAAMVNILSKAVNEGTGHSLRTRFGITHALAGKTGTTQNFTDGWFIGMTPDMVFGTWVGGWNSRVHFKNMGYASQTALPAAGYFLNNLQKFPELEPQADSFHPDQISTSFNLACSDYRDDRITDRIGDFFRGQKSDEARVIEEEDEKKGGNIFQRIGRLFGGN
ncbi:MAG: transglycosylase domain-containing protein [Balneolaceae bacterium]